MLATLFEGMWSTFGELVLVLVITFSTRFAGAFVLARAETMAATYVSDPSSISLSSNYFVRHWRGECSLGISYWLNGGVLAGIVPGALTQAVSLVEKGDYSLRAISFAGLGTLLFSVIAWLWSTVGIWRSARQHVARGGSSGWASAARVGVALGTIGMIAQLSTTILPQIKEFALIASGNDPIGNININVATNGQSVIVRGVLREGSAAEVQKILDAAPGATSLVLNSAGGRLFEAQQLARAVRIRHLNTYVEDQCASACTYVFLAGKDRASTPNARIGFHQPHFPGLDARAQRDMTNAMLTIYRGAELPEAFIQHIAKTPPEDMWYPTRDELIAAHVITRVSLGGEAAISLMGMRSKQELLLLLESIPLFQAIEKRFPGTTYEAVERGWAAKERGGTDAEVQSSMRSIISEIYPTLLKTADVSILDSYVKLMISEMSAAQAIGGEACTRLLTGELNIAHTLPREIVEKETQFVFLALASPSATAMPPLDRAQFTQAMQKVRANVPRKHLNVVDDMNAYINQPDLVCEAMVVFFRTIQALPSRQRDVVLRGWFHDEDAKEETSRSLALPEREPLAARRISQQAREQVLRSEQEESARTARKEAQLKNEFKHQAGEQYRGEKQIEKGALFESEATSERVLHFPEEEHARETKKNSERQAFNAEPKRLEEARRKGQEARARAVPEEDDLLRIPKQMAPQIVPLQTVSPPETILKGFSSGLSNSYWARVQSIISSQWEPPPVDMAGQTYTTMTVKFRLQRDGTIKDVAVQESSGNAYFDMAAQRAVLRPRVFPPFPVELTESYQDLSMVFTVGELGK